MGDLLDHVHVRRLDAATEIAPTLLEDDPDAGVGGRADDRLDQRLGLVRDHRPEPEEDRRLTGVEEGPGPRVEVTDRGDVAPPVAGHGGPARPVGGDLDHVRADADDLADAGRRRAVREPGSRPDRGQSERALAGPVEQPAHQHPLQQGVEVVGEPVAGRRQRAGAQVRRGHRVLAGPGARLQVGVDDRDPELVGGVEGRERGDRAEHRVDAVEGGDGVLVHHLDDRRGEIGQPPQHPDRVARVPQRLLPRLAARQRLHARAATAPELETGPGHQVREQLVGHDPHLVARREQPLTKRDEGLGVSPRAVGDDGDVHDASARYCTIRRLASAFVDGSRRP